MSGLQSRVQLISNALILLGGSPIASITEESTGATIGNNLFEGTYLAMLTTYRWNFATVTNSLSRLATVPNSGYSYAFQLPADNLQVIKADTLEYTIQGNELHCNNTTVKISYIARVEEDLLPAYFAKALEFNLASQFSVPLAGDLDKAQFYARAYATSIRQSRFADSTQSPQESFTSSPYTSIRY